MNRINPLYLGLLLIVILSLSIYKLNLAKNELKEVKLSYAKNLRLANELSSLRSVYKNTKKLENSLKRILMQNILKEAHIDVKFKKSGVKLSSLSINKKGLNFLMGKLLNNTYNIVALDIKKLSEQKASFKMEIQW